MHKVASKSGPCICKPQQVTRGDFIAEKLEHQAMLLPIDGMFLDVWMFCGETLPTAASHVEKHFLALIRKSSHVPWSQGSVGVVTLPSQGLVTHSGHICEAVRCRDGRLE